MEEAQIIVDVEASMQPELDKLWGNTNEAKNFTIFRTPHNIFQIKKDLFEPSVISIGPLHHGQEHLQALEEQKWRFLRDFLSRKDHISLNRCITKMTPLEERTRRCYSEKFDNLESKEFVKMMLLDGCFLLEYFLKRKEKKWDSILEVGWNCHFIFRDLVLLENQIPFFIVDELMELIGFRQEQKMNFAKYLAYTLLPKDSIFQNPQAEAPDTEDSIIANPLAEIPNPLAKIPDPPAEIHHLLHLCYNCLVPNPGIPVVSSSKIFGLTRMLSANRIINGLLDLFRSRVLGETPHSTSPSSSVPLPNSTGSMLVPSATELKQKGVKFAQQSNPRHMLHISFEYGVLKIPKLKITDFSKPLFANLLAFEHSKFRKMGGPFGRFISFLDKLINTPNDVIILQELKIIENWLGSEEELTDFFNQLSKGNFVRSNHYLANLYTEVNRYTESSWHRHRAKLIRDYFSNPWAIISVVAAFILLVLTLVQSFFAVFAYIHPPSP